MCTNYLNANVTLFKECKKEGDVVTGFNGPFEQIRSENCNGKLCIKDFNIVTFINLMGSAQNRKLIKAKRDKSLEEIISTSEGLWVKNILDERKKLQIRIRITKCTEIEYERAYVDVDEFEINTSEAKIFEIACVPFLNYKQVTHIERLVLGDSNPKGNYVVKVLAKTPDQEKFTVQAMEYFAID